MKFAHFLQSYEGQIEDLLDCEARFGKEHPHSLWAKAGAEETLASYYMANDDDKFRDHLHTALLSKIGWWKSGAGEFGLKGHGFFSRTIGVGGSYGRLRSCNSGMVYQGIKYSKSSGCFGSSSSKNIR